MAKRQLETRQVARDTGSNTADLGFVAEALAASEQRDRVMQQNQQNLNQLDAQKKEAMHQEAQQGLAQLGRAQHAGDVWQRMSDEVLNRHVDMGAANRDRLVAAQEAAGVPYTTVGHNTTNNYDQSSHSTLNSQDAAPQRPVWYLHAPGPDEQRDDVAFANEAH